MKPQYKFLPGFVLAAILGSLIWLLSPLLTGHQEPWDARSHYYICALLIAGFVPVFLPGTRFYHPALGVWLGQTATVLLMILITGDPGEGALWVIGLVFLIFYSLWALVGALFGMAVNRGLRSLRSRGPAADAATTEASPCPRKDSQKIPR